MLTVLDLAEQDTSFNRKKSARNEYKGPCPDPNCIKRNDGFCVKWDGERWVFMCRGCWIASDPHPFKKDGSRCGFGDAIDYLRHYRHMTYPQARAFLDGEQSQESSRQSRPRYTPQKYDYTSELWQEATTKTMQEYQTRLWSSSEGEQALAYAYRRGLSDDVIKGAHAGLSVKNGIARLCFPSHNDGRYVAIHCRDIRPVPPDDAPRWIDAPGSTKDELYLADWLKSKRPTVVVEAVIDALSIVQECGNIVNVVATGGTDGARSVKTLVQLARMPLVLLAFDADEGGDTAASWWKKRLRNAHRLRPILHDINDMLLDNWDIRAWIGMAIADISSEQEQSTVPTLDALPERCADCGAHIEQADRLFFYVPLANNPDQAECYCSLCRDENGAQLPQVTPEPEPEGGDELRREQFMNAVKRIASEVFPEGCEIHIDPPGYTLADRVRELQDEQQTRNKLSFWERIEEQKARFNPKKPVKWQDHGYKKDEAGRWYYARKDVKSSKDKDKEMSL